MSNLFVEYVKNNNTELLDDVQIKDLLIDYRMNHNLDSRDRLIANFYNMIIHIINNRVKDISKREDYITPAYMALSKCIDTFDLESPTKFSTVAYKYISNEITHEFNENNGLINIPYVEHVNAQKYAKAKKRLEDTYGRKLSVDEIAQLLDIKPTKILCYENEIASIYSLNKPLGDDLELGDVISDKYSLEEEVEHKDNTETLMNNICLLKDKRQQLILLYTYGMIDGQEHTQQEAIDMLVENGYEKMSRQNVQKLQKKALLELREMYN